MIEQLATQTDFIGKPLPKTNGWPVVGSLPGLARKKLDFIFEAQRQHGDIYSLDLGVTDMVVLAHPEQAKLMFMLRMSWKRLLAGRV